MSCVDTPYILFCCLISRGEDRGAIRPADAGESFNIDMNISHFAPRHPAVFLHMLTPLHVYFNTKQSQHNKSCMNNPNNYFNYPVCCISVHSIYRFIFEKKKKL